MSLSDGEIVGLYFQRDESAIRETAEKYGNYCYRIAMNILACHEDAEETVNDTWTNTWQAIPPARPNRLSLFLAAITRNLSFNRYRAAHAQKRGGGEFALVLEELEDCIPSSGENAEKKLLAKELGEAVSRFLKASASRERVLFLRRYYFGDSLGLAAERVGISENHAAVLLLRLRKALKRYLEKEGLL